MRVMTHRGGKGKEVVDYLRKALSVPEGVTDFTVKVGLFEAITVTCTYLPQEPAGTPMVEIFAEGQKP